MDYWTEAMKPLSREYTIEDESGNRYNVFCDFHSEEGVAWTLIESFSMNNEQPLFRYPFLLDYPLNEQHLNWEFFRLPKKVMVRIGSRSKYWRGSCSYPDYGVDYRDYVRVRMSDLNPITFVGGLTFSSDSCILIDFIDIKGTNCENCTTTIFQLSNEMIHIAPWWGRYHHDCNFNTANVEYHCPGTNERARLLGHYLVCSDPSYRCSETPSSTTQIWFGDVKKT